MSNMGKKPSEDFLNFLKKVKIKRGNKEVITHTSMCSPKGSFHIPECEMDTFISLYEKEVKNGSKIGITEMPISHNETPLVIDIDFKYESDHKDGKTNITRKHDINTIKTIVNSYQNVYGKYFSEENTTQINQVSDENTIAEEDRKDNLDKCYFFVTQRENPYMSNKGCIKDGIHIVCPYYRANPAIHLKLREEILKDTTLIDCFKNLGVIEDISYIIDENVICKNGWLMYGSSKPDKKPYELTNILDDNNQEIDKKIFKDISMPGFLSFWRNPKIYAKPSKDLFDEFSKEQLIYNSENDEKTAEINNEKLEEKVPKKTRRAKKILGVRIIDPENPKGLDRNLVYKSQVLVDLLSKKRAKDKITFKEVGECLYAIAPEDDLLESWINYGHKHKVDTSHCFDDWKKFSKIPDLSDDFSIKTLKFWVSKDNPSKFKKFKRNELRKYFCNGGFTDTHNDIAQALKLLYDLNYVCSSIGSNKWYQFSNHRWSKMEQAVHLKKKLSKEFAMEYRIFKDFCSIMSDYMIEKEEEGTIYPDFSDLKDYSFTDDDLDEIATYEFDQAEWEERMYKCDEIITRLKNNSFKSSIINEAREEFYIEDFEEQLDSKKELIAFENGVIDLDRRTFRYGRPDDYITLSTKTRYDPNYKKSPFYKDILLFFSQIYPTEDRFYDKLLKMSNEEVAKLSEFKLPLMMQYGLKEKAQTLHGHNFEERFFVHIGTGGNGKSKLKELTENALGNYCINFPITLITGKRAASNSCTPEITRSKGRRNGHFDEPEEKSRINSGLVKKMTGGDKLEGRDLHCPVIEFYFQASIFLLCNTVPKIPPHDEGMIRRLTISNFKARFVKNPDKSNPFEFKRDQNLSDKLKNMAPVFSSMLVHWFYIYKDQGLNPPKDITDYTSEFISQSDNYREFINDYLQISNNNNDFIKMKDLYNCFRTWNEENNSSRRLMSYKDFKDYIHNVVKNKLINDKQEGHIIKGYMINQELLNNQNNNNNRY